MCETVIKTLHIFVLVLLLALASIIFIHKFTIHEKPAKVLHLSTNTIGERFNMCDTVTTPSRILLRNRFWQYFKCEQLIIYIFRAYIDDRNFNKAPGNRVIRMFPMFTAPKGHQPKCRDFYILLWYSQIPVQSRCQCISVIYHKRWTIKDKQHGTFHLTCIIPIDNVLPSYVSLIKDKCDQPSTYVSLVVPQGSIDYTKQVGICVKGLYGTALMNNTPYFVSWLETLRSYGIPQVNLYYDDLQMDDIAVNVLNYYIKTGYISIERIPHNLYETDKPSVNMTISQSTVLALMNDCFYKNIHKYSYIIHSDMDELFVPRNKHSYQMELEHYFGKSLTEINAAQITLRSALFYLNYPKVNSDATDYLPLLQQAYRTPVEYPVHCKYNHTWSTTGTGVQKSLQSTQTCLVMSIHGCGLHSNHVNSKSIFLPSNNMISHHYRMKCKTKKAKCFYEWNRRIHDAIILNKIGIYLKNKVQYVLNVNGYLF